MTTKNKPIRFILGNKEEDSHIVRLNLQPSDDDEGAVDLVVLDEHAEIERYVMTFFPDGTFLRHTGGCYLDDPDAKGGDPGYRLKERQTDA